jgi:hypothetical protein
MVESAEKIFTCEQIPQTWGRFYESVTAWVYGQNLFEA